MTILADYATLMRQAPMTAQVYLMEAVKCIDKEFSKGYAEKHPELVAAFMEVCSEDFTTATLCVAVQEAAVLLSDGFHDDD